MSRVPVRPRDAASLILFRRRAGGLQVLMGRRRRGAAFMPGRYVFPGGTVDAGDGRARPASDLDPAIVAYARVGRRPGRARALAMAAVRETFEETGLLLAEPGDVGPVDHPGWRAMRRTGLAPALARLDYVGRAVTPTRSPMRFHARFFVADARFARGRLVDGGELVDLGWVPVAEVFRLPVADVTAFMLGEALRQRAAPAEERRRKPFFTYGASGPSARYSTP